MVCECMTASCACRWATRLDFQRYLEPDPALIASLRRSPLTLVAFTNGDNKLKYNNLIIKERKGFPAEIFG